MKRLVLFVSCICVLFSTAASASTLKIGLAGDIRSLDPYFHNETTTNSVLSNIFDGMVTFDGDLNVVPQLASEWKAVSDTVWEFKLRRNVKFHNGNPFNADDVLFSFDRIKNWAKSGFKGKVSTIEKIEKVDDYTVRVYTKGPNPILPRKITYMRILDKEFYADKSDEFISLHANGTGPYRLVKWSKGESIVLEANPDWWNGKPSIDKVVFSPLTNDATRISAILSGEVHIIERVPVRDVDRIKKNKKINFHMRPGLRLIYLQMDQDREHTPYVKGRNPLLDVRVRRAIYYGINEDAIVKYVMHGFAEPASQFHPEVVVGYDPSIKRPAYNPEKAKELLAEAGYPNGFEITLDSPNDRYVNDEQIAQAVASSLAKIGIKVNVNAQPKATFFPKTDRRETSFFLIGWASSDGDGSSFLDGIVHTYDTEKGYGRYNRGRYSNRKVDELIEKASATIDEEKRVEYLREAQQIALVQEQNIIPLHYQVDLYASSTKVEFTPRTDSYFYIDSIRFK